VTARRVAVWFAGLVFVVWLGRAIAYGLSDAPLAARLANDGGGTSPVAVAAVSLTAAAVVAAAALWLVATGVRERSRLELESWEQDRPAIRPAQLVARIACLSAASAVSFTSFESWLHWREGLGFHAYHCLFGPVHQDALPILAALSIVVAAAITAADALLAAARRAVARRLLRRPGPVRRPVAARPPLGTPHGIRERRRRSRGPPLTA
jgi:hypothetical protein